MNAQSILIAASSILALTSPIIYARSILKGEAKPHRTTRLVLLLITALSTASLIAQQDTVAVWLAGVSTLQAIIIFALSIKHGMGGWARTDILCLVIALAGIIAWQTTNNPAFGLYASILADFTGMVPTLIKAYRLPHTETVWFFGFDTVAGILTLFAVSALTTQQIAYPIYIAIVNAVMVLLIVRPYITKKLRANPRLPL